MSIPSDWPLSPSAIRFIFNEKDILAFSSDPLTCDLFPLSFGFYPNAAGHHMERVSHDDNLLIYCVGGEGELSLGEGWRKVNKGDLIALPRGRAHRYRSEVKLPWSIFWVHFSGNLAAHFIENIDPSGTVRHLGLAPQLIQDFERLMAARLMGVSQSYRVNVASNLRQILASIGITTPVVSGLKAASLDLSEIHGFMQRNIHQSLTLEDIAAHFAVSKFYFAKQYKVMTGQTPIQQFIRFKMEHACYLLDISSKQINEIAIELGYDDAYYFSRLFSRIMGLSPSKYRQLRKN